MVPADQVSLTNIIIQNQNWSDPVQTGRMFRYTPPWQVLCHSLDQEMKVRHALSVPRVRGQSGVIALLPVVQLRGAGVKPSV